MPWILRRVILCVPLMVRIGATSAIAQSPDLQERLTAVEAAVRSMQQRLDELIALSRNTRPPTSPIENVAPFAVDVTDAAGMGSLDAKIAIIEYADFQCPFCGAHAKQAYREVQQQFVSTGKVKYIFRNFPIENSHPHALKAAEAAECVRASGKFWDMHDRLFTNQEALAVSDLTAHARALGVDIQACLAEGQMTSKVRAEQAEARRLGITGTPTFLLGHIESHDTVRVTQKIVGSQPIGIFQAALQTMLPAAGPSR